LNKTKEIKLKGIEAILEISIYANLAYCSTISDSLTGSNTSDLADKLTNIVLKIVSEDTLIFIGILNILQNKR